MNLLNPGVKHFALYDDNGNSVTIDGNDIDTGSALNATQLTRGVSARGGVKKTNKRWELDMQHSDKAALTALEALPDAPDYKFSVVKLNGFVFWNEKQTFSLEDSVILDPESEDYPFGINMSDIRSNPDIRQSINAATPWADKDSDGIADGYTTAATTTSFANGAQTIGRASDFNLSKILVLPFPGLVLNMGVTFNTLHSDGQNQIRMIFRNSAGNVLTTESQNVNSTGRHTLTATAPTNTFSVNFQPINVSGVTASSTPAEIAEPTLRTDNSTWFDG